MLSLHRCTQGEGVRKVRRVKNASPGPLEKKLLKSKKPKHRASPWNISQQRISNPCALMFLCLKVWIDPCTQITNKVKSFFKTNELIKKRVNLLSGIVSLANRNSWNDPLRSFFFSQIFRDQIAAHREADADELRRRKTFRQVRHHSVEIGGVA